MTELHQTLQTLRRQAGLTQEELAEKLFVSRTAISKWESGKGYPSIDSLKAIAAFFNVKIDDLLSGDEILSLAEEQQQRSRAQDPLFGLLDSSMILFLFLPLFGQTVGDIVQCVSLLSLTAVSPWLRIAFSATVAVITAFGIATLALQACKHAVWLRCKAAISVLLSAVAVLLFILCRQPYAAALVFVFLIIKVIVRAKQA